MTKNHKRILFFGLFLEFICFSGLNLWITQKAEADKQEIYKVEQQNMMEIVKSIKVDSKNRTRT